MKTPRLQRVNFDFTDGYAVNTRPPFDVWMVWRYDDIVATYNVNGRKDVTKYRAIRILKNALEIKPKKGSRLREAYEKAKGKSQ